MILSLLWQKSTNLLSEYVRGTSVVLRILNGDSHRQIVEAMQESGSRVYLDRLSDYLPTQIIDIDKMVDSYLEQIKLSNPVLHLQLVARSREKLRIDFANQVAMIEYLTSLKLQQKRFVVLVSEEYTQLPRIAVDWCSRNGIPTIHVVHGANLNRQYTVHSLIKSRFYVVPGRKSAESLLDLGLSPDRIFCIPSQEYFDGIRSGAQRPDLIGGFSDVGEIPHKKISLLFATTFDAGLTFFRNKNVHEQTLKIFLEACMSLRSSGYSLSCIVKDRISNIANSDATMNIIRSYQEKGLHLSVACDNITSAIDRSDVVISVDSSVSIDAMVRNRVVINLTGYEGVYPEPAFSITDIQHATPRTLGITLARVMSDIHFRKQLIERQRRVLPEYVQVGAMPPARMFADLLKVVLEVPA